MTTQPPVADDGNVHVWQKKRLDLLTDRVSQVILRAEPLSPVRKATLADTLAWASSHLREQAIREAQEAEKAIVRQARYEEVRGGLVEPATPSYRA